MMHASPMMRQIVSSIVKRVDIKDPHEFATTFVNYVEECRRDRKTPMHVNVAADRWAAFRTV